jgi:hypothetical protein
MGCYDDDRPTTALTSDESAQPSPPADPSGRSTTPTILSAKEIRIANGNMRSRWRNSTTSMDCAGWPNYAFRHSIHERRQRRGGFGAGPSAPDASTTAGVSISATRLVNRLPA